MIRLKVAEAFNNYVNDGIAGIDSEAMKKLNVDGNDYVEIEGKRKTPVRVSRFYPPDKQDIGLIRIDAMTRKNAKTGIGEYVKVRKADIKFAEKVIVSAAKKGTSLTKENSLLLRCLMDKSLVKGDIIYIGMPEVLGDKQDILFRVFSSKRKEYFAETIVIKKTEPAGIVMVYPKTEVEVE